MKTKRSRREFIQVSGLAASGLMAAASPLSAAAPEPQARPAARSMGARLRELLQKRAPFANIAVDDVVTGRMVELMGFPSLYLGSTASAEYQGLPDWDITSISDQIEFFGNIARNVGIPVIADIAEGNDPVVLYRATKEFERAGVGGIHIVDAAGKLGQTTGLISKQAMVDRIRAAADARTDMVITARAQGGTAASKETKEQAIERAVAYAQAGADAVWLTGLQFEDLPKAADAVKVPLMAQIFVDTPASKAKESRVTVAVYASFMQNIAQSAVYDALAELKNTGMLTKSAKGQRLGSTIPAEFRAKLLQTTELTDRGKKYSTGS